MSEIRQLSNDNLLKVEPPAAVEQAPSPPAPVAEDRQAVDQAFTQRDEDEESLAAMLTAWQMLPLLHERHLKKAEEEKGEGGEEEDGAKR